VWAAMLLLRVHRRAVLEVKGAFKLLMCGDCQTARGGSRAAGRRPRRPQATRGEPTELLALRNPGRRRTPRMLGRRVPQQPPGQHRPVAAALDRAAPRGPRLPWVMERMRVIDQRRTPEEGAAC
jgi:hypothetical protein